MTKRESSGPERPSPILPPARSSPRPIVTGTTPRVYTKRKVEDENGVETEENGVRPKVGTVFFFSSSSFKRLLAS